MSTSGLVVGLIGASQTGKTALAQELARVLTAKGMEVRLIPDDGGSSRAVGLRTQQQDILAARASHQLVLIDNLQLTAPGANAPTALGVDLILLMSVDLLWTQAYTGNVSQQEALDSCLRQHLHAQALPYVVVAGQRVSRLQHALAAVEHLIDGPTRKAQGAGKPRWRWFCDNCDDGECEQHWLPRPS
jgi:hypothetical protein